MAFSLMPESPHSHDDNDDAQCVRKKMMMGDEDVILARFDFLENFDVQVRSSFYESGSRA